MPGRGAITVTVSGHAGAMSSAPHRLLYDHARWLVDRQAVRLTSIESRGAALVGWSGVQVTLTLAVIGIATRIAPGWERTTAIWLLGAGVACLAAALLCAVLRVLRPRSTAAPNTDIVNTWRELAEATGDDLDRHLADALIGSLINSEPSVLTELSCDVDTRAGALKWAAGLVAAAVVADVASATMFLAATTGS